MLVSGCSPDMSAWVDGDHHGVFAFFNGAI
jgi:hypothetical protein